MSSFLILLLYFPCFGGALLGPEPFATEEEYYMSGEHSQRGALCPSSSECVAVVAPQSSQRGRLFLLSDYTIQEIKQGAAEGVLEWAADARSQRGHVLQALYEEELLRSTDLTLNRVVRREFLPPQDEAALVGAEEEEEEEQPAAGGKQRHVEPPADLDRPDLGAVQDSRNASDSFTASRFADSRPASRSPLSSPHLAVAPGAAGRSPADEEPDQRLGQKLRPLPPLVQAPSNLQRSFTGTSRQAAGPPNPSPLARSLTNRDVVMRDKEDEGVDDRAKDKSGGDGGEEEPLNNEGGSAATTGTSSVQQRPSATHSEDPGASTSSVSSHASSQSRITRPVSLKGFPMLAAAVSGGGSLSLLPPTAATIEPGPSEEAAAKQAPEAKQEAETQQEAAAKQEAETQQEAAAKQEAETKQEAKPEIEPTPDPPPAPYYLTDELAKGPPPANSAKKTPAANKKKKTTTPLSKYGRK